MNKLLLSILISFGVLGCSAQGTSTGNPVVAVSFNPYNAAASAKVSQNVTTQSISSLIFCFKRLRFKQNLTLPATDDNIDLALGEVNISNLGVAIASVGVPAGTYVRVEFDLDNHCASGKSIQVTNSNGSFSTAQGITIRFDGIFYHTTNEPLALNVQPITSALNTVAADSDIVTKAQSASGSY